jgi:hypothetical protein
MLQYFMSDASLEVGKKFLQKADTHKVKNEL